MPRANPATAISTGSAGSASAPLASVRVNAAPRVLGHQRADPLDRFRDREEALHAGQIDPRFLDQVRSLAAATPPGASGKVYGFVYSGLDLGSSLTPLLFGWLLDRGEPRAVFVVAAVFMLLTITTVVQVRRHGVRSTAAA